MLEGHLALPQSLNARPPCVCDGPTHLENRHRPSTQSSFEGLGFWRLD